VRQRPATKLESFVKTTGGGPAWCRRSSRCPDDAKEFCRRVAEQMSADSPDRFAATIKKLARKNRIFIDYLRNSRRRPRSRPPMRAVRATDPHR
jgi:bifunctional non-homologous end joining protein LigD